MMGILVPGTCWGNKLHTLSHLFVSLSFTYDTFLSWNSRHKIVNPQPTAYIVGLFFVKIYKFWNVLKTSIFCIITLRLAVIQYSETNVTHFLLSLLRIKRLYMFQALLAHPRKALHKRCVVYQLIAPGAANWHNTHAIYQVSFVQHHLRLSK
jgi:hypothetical protein